MGQDQRKKPLIGIILNLYNNLPRSVSDTGTKFNLTETQFFDAVWAAGGIPVALGINLDEERAAELVAELDGLIIPGCIEDLYPGYEGNSFSKWVGQINLEKDTTDILYAKAMLARKKPILGICRGMQLLNHVLGGTMIKDIATYLGSDIAHYPSSHVEPDLPIHTVKYVEGSQFEKTMGPEPIPVNSFHHQCLDKLGEGLTLAGSAPDGILECYEGIDEDHPYFGTQWHPEAMWQTYPRMLGVFTMFVEAAAERM